MTDWWDDHAPGASGDRHRGPGRTDRDGPSGPRPRSRWALAEVGELVGELAKSFALLAFGALVTGALLGTIGVAGWLLAALTLLIGRPAPVLISLVGSDLDPPQRRAAAWFGPKGFASVVYGLIVLESGIPDADTIFGLVVATVAVSIALHSTTDVPVADLLGATPHPTHGPSPAPGR